MSRKLALALVAPLLLVACAEEAERADLVTDADAGAADPIAALRAAPDLVADAGSARFEMVFAFDTPDGPLELTASGGYAGDRMSMEMDLGAMLGEVAEGAGEDLPPGFEEPMEMVLDGQTVYLRMPMLEMLTGTTGWLSATPDELGAGGDALGITGTATSPAQLLETLRGVSDEVDELGTEEVRGVRTTRYRATVDVEKVLEAIPPEQRVQMEKQLDDLGGVGIDSVPLDVWVDDDGLPRRVQMAFDDMGAEMGLPGSATMTMELFDYGQPVTIEVPPASEVTPIAEVMPGMAGALG